MMVRDMGQNCGHEGCNDHHRHPPEQKGGVLGIIAPLVACLFCPACMSAWLKLLALAGVGFMLTESEHLWLLLGASAVAVFTAWLTARQSRRWACFAMCVAGASAMISAHFLDELVWLEWSGAALMVTSALFERWKRVVSNAQRVRAAA
ncbi:MAG: MerC domain-containing protein [Myxococcaceae bacterium]|nr:MerC domain-containing protein [Myxococcaceae bacterium]